MKHTFKAGVLYFALVFAAGFALGTMRTLWVMPRLGARTAELIEQPVMLGVSILAARWSSGVSGFRRSGRGGWPWDASRSASCC